MQMFFLPLSILIILCLAEIYSKKYKEQFYYISFLVLLIFLCFRYGQGTDYFGYYINYNFTDLHSEIGYKLIAKMFFYFGVPFEVFIGMISTVQMLLLSRGIRIWSPYKNTSLLLAYPTVYLTYFFSGIRQGIVIAVFFGVLLEWLYQEKYIKYVIGSILLLTIHSSAIVLIPLVLIKKIRIKWIYILIGLGTCVGTLLLFVPKGFYNQIPVYIIRYYFSSMAISYIGLADRIIMFILITLLICFCGLKQRKEINYLYKIYIYGFAIYMCFFPCGLISSRLFAVVKVVDIALIPLIAYECREKIKKMIVIFVLAYVCMMTAKNVMTSISESGATVYNIISYPYIGVWDKDHAIKIYMGKYRK